MCRFYLPVLLYHSPWTEERKSENRVVFVTFSVHANLAQYGKILVHVWATLKSGSVIVHHKNSFKSSAGGYQRPQTLSSDILLYFL